MSEGTCESPPPNLQENGSQVCNSKFEGFVILLGCGRGLVGFGALGRMKEFVRALHPTYRESLVCNSKFEGFDILLGCGRGLVGFGALGRMKEFVRALHPTYRESLVCNSKFEENGELLERYREQD